jgi:hypothetical protein
MMGTEIVPKMSVIFNQLIQLIAHENFFEAKVVPILENHATKDMEDWR